VAVIIDVLTDNRNRVVSEIRHAFTKNGGNLGETGSVSFMWNRVGQIVYPAGAGSEDAVMEAAIEAGADDVESDLGEDGEGHVITTSFEDLSSVAEALEAVLGAAKSTRVIWKPQTETPISGDPAVTLMKLIDALDDDDDVQNVWSNADIPEDELAKLAG
jgi:YebC/PmpR family DNA-binding regulatory protein